MSEQKQYSDEMTGILGKNDFQKEPKHPDKRGRCKLRGIWFWVSGWDKQGQNGPFISLAFTEMTAEEAAKYENRSAQRSAPQQGGNFGQQGQQAPVKQQPAQQPPARQEGQPNPDATQDFDDDIPF